MWEKSNPKFEVLFYLVQPTKAHDPMPRAQYVSSSPFCNVHIYLFMWRKIFALYREERYIEKKDKKRISKLACLTNAKFDGKTRKPNVKLYRFPLTFFYSVIVTM